MSGRTTIRLTLLQAALEAYSSDAPVNIQEALIRALAETDSQGNKVADQQRVQGALAIWLKWKATGQGPH